MKGDGEVGELVGEDEGNKREKEEGAGKMKRKKQFWGKCPDKRIIMFGNFVCIAKRSYEESLQLHIKNVSVNTL